VKLSIFFLLKIINFKTIKINDFKEVLMRKFIFFVSVLFMFSSSAAFSQEYFQDVTRTESWYTYWGLGYSSINYPSEIQNSIDNITDTDGVSHISLNLDLLGIYFNVTPKTIAGVIINAVGDRYEINGDNFQINQYLYSASAMHYLGEYFGSGPFLRADIGLAKLVLDSSVSYTVGSDIGFGFLVGGGWSFDFGGTRLLLNVNYAYRGVESQKYNTIGFSVGGLF